MSTFKLDILAAKCPIMFTSSLLTLFGARFAVQSRLELFLLQAGPGDDPDESSEQRRTLVLKQREVTVICGFVSKRYPFHPRLDYSCFY